MRRSRVIAFVIVTVACGAAAACGLDEGGVLVSESPDGSVTPDGATVDGPISDGPTGDGPVTSGDGGSKDGSPADGAIPFDAGKPYFCGTTPVADCTTDCAGSQIACGTLCVATCAICVGSNFECDGCFTDGGRSVSVCEPQDASAFASCLSGQSRCPCSDQGDCPGPFQTCTPGVGCFECEEPDANNGGQSCKIGGGCKTGVGNFGMCM